MFVSDVHYSGDGKFYEFTAMSGLIVGIIMVIGYLVKIIPESGIISFVQLGFSALWALFNLIAACILIKWIRFYPACGAVVFFAFVATAIYLVDTLIILMGIRGRGLSGGGTTQPDSGQSEWTTQQPLPKY